MTLRLVSLSTNGIRNTEKRRAIFDHYRANADILCLQETHCSNELEPKIWTAEWGGCAFFANGSSTSKGVGIFINQKFFCNVHAHYSDPSGRFQILDTEINDVKLSIINIYAPNSDSPGFFHALNNQMKNRYANKIIIGDFNLVLNTKMDRKNSLYNNHNACETLKSIMSEHNMCDIFRELHPSDRRYSWFRLSKGKASRIDYSIISESLKNRVANTTYFQGIHTDHSAYLLSIDLYEHKRGSGYWKFNNSLLKRADFVKSMNVFLEEKLQDYAEKETVSKWERIKKDIKQFSMNYSKNLASEKQLIISQLSEKVSDLQDKYEYLSSDEIDTLITSKADLEEMTLDRARSVIFRSKARWNCEAEVNSRYFYNLEKNRADCKTCFKLVADNGEVITNADDILAMQMEFYEKLYKADPSVHFECDFTPEAGIPEHYMARSEDKFTDAEISEAVLRLNNDKTPGPDGIPIDFYKVFWSKLKRTVCDVIHEFYRMESVCESSRQGVINLIPKKGKDVHLLKNLRPITLLNSDYKIVEKAIANRMVPALEEIIHSDQAGFLPNRKIETNIRKIFDL